MAKAYQEIIVRTGHMPSPVFAIPTDHRLILSRQKRDGHTECGYRGRPGFGPRFSTCDRHRHKGRHSRRATAGTQGRMPPAREGKIESEQREREGTLMRERVCVPHMHKHARIHTHAQAHTCTFTHMHMPQAHTPVASSCAWLTLTHLPPHVARSGGACIRAAR